MTGIDPAKPLKAFKPKHKFFVGIDSDGCLPELPAQER
jgi:hypothetical protein